MLTILVCKCRCRCVIYDFKEKLSPFLDLVKTIECMLNTDVWWQWIKWEDVYENSMLFILFSKVFTKVNSFEAKMIQLLIWYEALDFTETPRYSKSEICNFSLFFLVKWNKIITLKRFRGFTIPSQYSMTLSKRFEWHWSHGWSTKLATILLLEYCGA